MLKLLLLSLALMSTVFADNGNSKNVLLSAAEKFTSGDVDAAYGLFDQVSVNTPEFTIAFVEMQKIHYLKANWDKFFGYAQFYRKNLMKGKFIPELILLESMALIKHCQFEPSLVLIESAKKIAGRLNINGRNNSALEKIESVEDLFEIQKSIPGNVSSTEMKSSSHAFSSDLFWNINSLGGEGKSFFLTDVVKSPRAIRVYVKNLCEEKKS